MFSGPGLIDVCRDKCGQVREVGSRNAMSPVATCAASTRYLAAGGQQLSWVHSVRTIGV